MVQLTKRENKIMPKFLCNSSLFKEPLCKRKVFTVTTQVIDTAIYFVGNCDKLYFTFGFKI